MKNILVTGAQGGIGASIVRMLQDAGYNVVSVTHEDADLSSAESVALLRERVTKEISSFDWVICAHGYVDTETVWENQTSEHTQETFAVNTLSIFYIAQQFLPSLTEGGGMIAISSSAGVQPNGRLATYSASKAAVNALMQAFARNKPEYRFVTICPGPTNTQMRERLAGDAAKMQSPDVIAEAVRAAIENTEEYKSGDILLVRDGVTTTVSRL